MQRMVYNNGLMERSTTRKGRAMPNVIDLFAGAGGLSLGAARAGFKIVAALEHDPHAIESHVSNFPNSRHIQRDILGINGDELLQLSGLQANELIGVIGGPPCQGFSNIGRGEIEDNRNILFERFFELVEELQPLFFVAENVPGIMKLKYEKIRQDAFAHIHDYHLLPPVRVNASEYGAPTTRTRYFFIGYRNDPRINALTSEDIELMKVPLMHKTNVRTALEGLPSNIRYHPKSNGIRRLDQDYWNVNARRSQCAFFHHRVIGMRPCGLGNAEYIRDYENKHAVNGFLPTRHSSVVRQRYAQLAFGEQDRISKSIRLDPDSYCPTLRAGTGPDKGSYQAVRPIHSQYDRVITPREAARLQGFPDWYKLPDTIWHSFRQIGNSVSPIVAEQVMRAIFQKLT